MPTVSQISNSPNLFADTGQRVITTNSSVTANDAGVAQTDQEEAEELQQQFLQILLTQLQNQNPLDPVDTTEYTNQLVQYSSLEQQIDTNLRLTNILDSLQVSSSFSAFSYIGNSVEIATNQTAVQDDIADWTYALSGDADAVEIRVVNQTGSLVYEENLGGQSSGSYGFSLSADDGQIPVGEGDVLTISINAKLEDGSDIEVDTITNVQVDSVETGASGDIVLRSGGLFFGVNDILKISQSTTSTATNSNDEGDNSNASS